MGLVREQAFAFLFGAGHATDAFNVAFRIPNLLRDLFAEGAMSAALVPTFTRVRAEEGDRRAWRVAGLAFRVLLGIVSILAIAGIYWAPELVGLYAKSFAHVPGQTELTVLMTRIMYPFFPLVALAAAFMGILNACGKFFLPAFASALFNVTSILVGVGLSLWLPSVGVPAIIGMAIGVLAGGAVQALCQLPSLYAVGYRYPPGVSADPPWYRDPALRRMLALMIPGLIGLAATQVSVLVNTILATSQGAGAVSYLNYSFRLMQFPIGIFGVSLAAATLPAVSRLWVSGDSQGVADTLSKSLRNVFAINLPASAGLAFLGVPIVALLFEHGAFDSHATAATAAALAAYSIGLTAYSVVKVIVPACYALGATRLAVTSSLLTVGLTVGLNLWVVDRLGYVGLALGTSIGAFFNAIYLLFGMRKRLAQGHGGASARFAIAPLIRSFVAYSIVSCVMGAACLYAHTVMSAELPDMVLGQSRVLITLVRLFKIGITIALGAGVVLGLAKLLGLDEMRQAVDLFARKLKKKLSRSES